MNTLGAVAYAAYIAALDRDGMFDPIPFSALPDELQNAWEAGARAVTQHRAASETIASIQLPNGDPIVTRYPTKA